MSEQQNFAFFLLGSNSHEEKLNLKWRKLSRNYTFCFGASFSSLGVESAPSWGGAASHWQTHEPEKKNNIMINKNYYMHSLHRGGKP